MYRETRDEMTEEERDILERFDRGELRRAAGADREIQSARQAARATFNKTKQASPANTSPAAL